MMNQFRHQLRRYAEHNPKTSSALLVTATALSCAAMVGFIEMRDRYKYEKRYGAKNKGGDSHTEPTRHEAQLAAMLENAKNSSWQENLENAADAQQRFMIPGRDIEGGNSTPEFVRRIDERSEEILREGKERQEKERERLNDPSRTKFWR